MDPHQHGLPDDPSNPIAPQPYPFYPEQDPATYALGTYNAQMSQYHQVHGGPQTRPLSVTEMQQQGMQQFHNISLAHQFQQPGFPPSPPHVNMPISTSPSPDMYDPLSPPISGSDTSADGIYHHNSSGQNSPTSSRANSLVHRNSIRYNPTPSPTSSSGRRSRGRSHDSDDEGDMGAPFTENLAHSRKEATRRQRIEAEQRRRDELRDGYAKLKDVLPVSNQKSSKVSLLERATQHIIVLEKTNQELQARINALEQELHRIRALNEKISLDANETSSFSRPLSPPPDVPLPAHSIIPPRGVDQPSDESSTSEDGRY